jgi:cytoskeletal protein CcmA (bactofilin family)
MNRLIAAFALLVGVSGLASADDDTVRASLRGNEFLAGGYVELSDRVSRSAFVSGGDVLVDGSVGRNLFAAGGDVRLVGEVDGDVRLAGGTLKVSSEARIGDDATLAGGSIVMDGEVSGDLRAYGERIVVNGSVDGDVEFAGENLRLGPDARIGGRVVYRSRDDIVVAEGAEVAGGISKATKDRSWRRIAHGATIVGGITVSLGMVLLGAVLVLGMPRFSRDAGVAILQKPWQVLGLGCTMLIGVPVALAVLVVTIVGIPLALLLAFAYAAILMLGYLIAAIFVGDFVLERIDKAKLESVWWRALFMLLAVIAIAIVRQVPLAGSLVWWVLFLAGVGAFTMRAWQGFKNDPAVA